MGTPNPFRARFGFAVRAIALTDSASLTIDAQTTDIAILASVSQDVLFNTPIGDPLEGQSLKISITSSLSRAISFSTGFVASSSISLPLATTGGGKQDFLEFLYNATTLKWVLVSSTIAFSQNPPSSSSPSRGQISAIGSTVF